ncbi:dTDP-4-dehydrorhamnose reductase [Carnimonas nigrificans]|uniref:dTDP-4-dehydrorhamnose reductase n=1 Tax=Carnimonas nigrificans TaxID=64323 RepID=UPI0004729957|nr:dTDP-4-dehydrorhamnose reductase [Carnimonas nigrificans]
MNILLLGANGQVGWALRRSLSVLGRVTALGRENTAVGCGDLNDAEGIERTLMQLKPDVIVNAAAYTAVDAAEENQQHAFDINAQAPALLARLAKRLNALLVHYSTDYVFDGSGSSSWQEDSPTGPLNVYGASKLAGEKAICASGCRALILRTSWVFSTQGKSFISTMMRLIREKPALSVVADQWGAPTSAELIADMTAFVLRSVIVEKAPLTSSILHLTAAGETSWFEYACFIKQLLEEAGEKPLAEITPVTTSEYPTPAARPLNSRLNTESITALTGLTLPAWQRGVERAVVERLWYGMR